MIKESELNKPFYKINEISKMMQIKVNALRGWEKKGKVQFERTSTNIRFLTKEKLVDLLQKEQLYFDDSVYEKGSVFYTVGKNKEDALRIKKEFEEVYARDENFYPGQWNCEKFSIFVDSAKSDESERPELLRLVTMIAKDEVGFIFVKNDNDLDPVRNNYFDILLEMKNIQIIQIEEVLDKE